MPTLIHSQPVVNISPKRFEGHHLLSLHPKKVVLDTGLTTPLQLLLCCKLQKIVDDISQNTRYLQTVYQLAQVFLVPRKGQQALVVQMSRAQRTAETLDFGPFVGSGCTIVPSNNHLGQWWTTTESRGEPWFLAATKSFPAKKTSRSFKIFVELFRQDTKGANGSLVAHCHPFHPLSWFWHIQERRW